jgi:hypothetical protein
MKLVRSPPDGSCFFHAVGHAVGKSANELRTLASRLVLEKQDIKYNDLALSEWIQLETGLKAREYAKKIADSTWGGAVEMTLFCEHFYRHVVVYARTRGLQAERILVVEPQSRKQCQASGPIFLLYSGRNHYDALCNEA